MTIIKEKDKKYELWQEVNSLTESYAMLEHFPSRLWNFHRQLNINDLEIDFILKVMRFNNRTYNEVEKEQSVDMRTYLSEQRESLIKKNYLVIRKEKATKNGVEGIKTTYDFTKLAFALNRLSEEYRVKLSERLYKLKEEIELLEKEEEKEYAKY